MKVSDFYTVPKSEAGIKVPLLKSDGTESGEWLLVIGPDSKRFGKAVAELNRGLADLRETKSDSSVKDDAELRDALADELLANYVEKLVIGWSFVDPFTPEALRDLLKNAPSIAMSIPNISTDRSRFFGQDSSAFTPGPTSSDESDQQSETATPILRGRKHG